MATPDHLAADAPTASPHIDILTATANEIQEHLSQGRIKSNDLIDLYLDQIQRHNMDGLELRAMISVTGRELLLEQARHLDKER